MANMDTTLNVRNLDTKNLYDVAGRWIAVTGAGEFRFFQRHVLPEIHVSLASGIGRQLAYGLTVNGANIVMIDRNEASLQLVKSELDELRKKENLGATTILMYV